MSDTPLDRANPDRQEAGGGVKWFERRLNLTEMFSFLTHFGMVYTPVDTRRPIREVLAELGAQPVAAYARWPHVLGVLMAILFALEAFTGVLLAYYFQPTPDGAFESTMKIVRDVPVGWFVHQMHAWGAFLLVAVIVARLFRLFWDGIYRAPREVLWMAAIGLGWIAVQADFTGHLLPWDSRSYWATMRGLEVAFAIPLAGPVLAYLLGGRVVDADVLTRFYVLHVMVLPFAFAVLIYLTFATIRRVGLSPDPSSARVTTTFKEHLYWMIILLVVMFSVLVTVSVLVPFPFRPIADPYHTPAGTRPPWYMLAPYTLFQWIPGPDWIVGLVLFGAAFAVFLLPFWIRGDETPQRRLVVRIWGVAALVVWTLLSIAGVFLDRP